MVSFVYDDVHITPDRQIGLHSAASWELSFVTFGEGVRTVGDLTEPFRAGEIVLVPPGIPHVWRFDPEVTDPHGCICNISVFFDPELLASLRRLFPELSPALDRLESLTQAVFYTGRPRAEIAGLLFSMRGLASDRRLPFMMELLLAMSDFSESRSAGRSKSLGRMDQRIERVRVYCACNYGRRITLDEICRHVGMNRSSFCVFMRRHVGMTLSEFVNRIRLDRAREKLLHTDRNISEIAVDCGFQNVTYFNRLFKASFGFAPGVFRHSAASK